MREEGGLHEPSGMHAIGPAFATGQQRRTFLLSDTDVVLHPFPLLLAHHWADVGVGIAWISGSDMRYRLLCDVLEFGQAVARHEDTRPGNASLAAIGKTGLQYQRHDGGKVCVGQHDRGRLATQFQGHALHGLRTGDHQMLADCG